MASSVRWRIGPVLPLQSVALVFLPMLAFLTTRLVDPTSILDPPRPCRMVFDVELGWGGWVGAPFLPLSFICFSFRGF